jgi:hypothetical protein
VCDFTATKILDQDVPLEAIRIAASQRMWGV